MDPKRFDPPRERAARLDRVRIALVGLVHGLAAGLRATMRPEVVIASMLFVGDACAVIGVWMLVGTAWAFIAAAVVLFGLAGLALRGLTRA